MSQHQEIEYKILIPKEIYNQILNDYQKNISSSYTQTNHYFTHPILQDKKYMLRVREKNNTFELTLKRPYKNHNIETNVMIDEKTYHSLINHEMIDNEIISLLKQEGINPFELDHQFSLKTLRHDICLDEGILSIDYNQYHNKEDYELEFEVNDESIGYTKFLQIIHPYHLEYTKNAPSKFLRALSSL